MVGGLSLAVCLVFFVGYLAIAFEHRLRLNKAASAMFTGVLCWSLYACNFGQILEPAAIPSWFSESLGSQHAVGDELAREYLLEHQLGKNLSEIAAVLFFLLGAMTIVELVDAFEGFAVITSRIRSTSRRKLLWVLSFLTFFLSAVLDNLTTTIVMIALVRKLVDDKHTRWMLASMIVCAANAGGAWTVIGDVTTTMLWIKDKISPLAIMQSLVVPSLVCMFVPLTILSLSFKGEVRRPNAIHNGVEKVVPAYMQLVMLCAGLIGLLFVPVFKVITHLPPFMGILLSLSVLWMIAELVRVRLDERTRSSTHILEVLRRVDSSTILFFLGILLAIGCLSSMGLLTRLANQLEVWVGNQNAIAMMIGLVSSIVDNVPLVAAGIEMYPYETDHPFWTFLAYCAGTGGSCLIIGSAAGVAAMGLEHIDFGWYLKHIAPLALVGYLAGAMVYLLGGWL